MGVLVCVLMHAGVCAHLCVCDVSVHMSTYKSVAFLRKVRAVGGGSLKLVCLDLSSVLQKFTCVAQLLHGVVEPM